MSQHAAAKTVEQLQLLAKRHELVSLGGSCVLRIQVLLDHCCSGRTPAGQAGGAHGWHALQGIQGSAGNRC